MQLFSSLPPGYIVYPGIVCSVQCGVEARQHTVNHLFCNLFRPSCAQQTQIQTKKEKKTRKTELLHQNALM